MKNEDPTERRRLHSGLWLISTLHGPSKLIYAPDYADAIRQAEAVDDRRPLSAPEPLEFTDVEKLLFAACVLSNMDSKTLDKVLRELNMVTSAAQTIMGKFTR